MKKLIITLIAIIILMSTVLFYWYEVRVSLAVKQCSEKASIEVNKPRKSGALPYPDNYKSSYDLEYKQCLRSKGLNQ